MPLVFLTFQFYLMTDDNRSASESFMRLSDFLGGNFLTPEQNQFHPIGTVMVSVHYMLSVFAGFEREKALIYKTLARQPFGRSQSVI